LTIALDKGKYSPPPYYKEYLQWTEIKWKCGFVDKKAGRKALSWPTRASLKRSMMDVSQGRNETKKMTKGIRSQSRTDPADKIQQIETDWILSDAMRKSVLAIDLVLSRMVQTPCRAGISRVCGWSQTWRKKGVWDFELARRGGQSTR